MGTQLKKYNVQDHPRKFWGFGFKSLAESDISLAGVTETVL